MSRHWAWQTLGRAPTGEAGAIRRAYADRLRALDIDRDAAAYANLREARDWALRWAKDNPGGEVPAPVTEADGNQASGPAEGDQADDDDDDEDWQDFAGDWSEIKLDLPPGLTLQRPRFEVVGEIPGRDAVTIERDHDRKLHALLYANDDNDETAFTADELAEAQRHLAAILSEAEGGNLAAHDAIESWLAPTLAGAWPRCAPLLEAADASFQWSRMRGRLGERPAVAFLNDRLRGMRFEAKVLDPGHPLHKAWHELTQPGRGGAFKGWRVNRKDVQQLLQGVRTNFPELEHRFDPQRVASWEGQGAGSDGSSGPGVWFWVFLILALVRVVGAFDNDRTPNRAPLAEPVVQVDPALTELAMTTTFGEGKTIEWLRQAQPELALTIQANLRESVRVKDDQGRTLVKVLSLVRERAYRSKIKSAGKDLETLMQIRHNQLVMARSVSPATCIAWIDGADYKSIGSLPDGQARQEQAFHAGLAVAQELNYTPRIKASSASVPGELIGRVIKATGLSDAQVRRAMGDQGSDEVRCAVHTALIAQTLRWKGPERAAIFRVL